MIAGPGAARGSSRGWARERARGWCARAPGLTPGSTGLTGARQGQPGGRHPRGAVPPVKLGIAREDDAVAARARTLRTMSMPRDRLEGVTERSKPRTVDRRGRDRPRRASPAA